ncbi:MAG: ATP-binding cassette domain-containing protein [bacterium]
MPHEIFGIIGPANSGKTSFLKVLNRMDPFTTGMHFTGTVEVGGRDVRAWRNLRPCGASGSSFPLPVGLPLSVYDNVAFAPRLAGVPRRPTWTSSWSALPAARRLWDEVKDRLKALGSLLSGSQQQLTIARALSQEPSILLLDEFSIAVDPVTTMRIEEVLKGSSRREMTIVLVTNLVQQARRLADRTAFFLMGECVCVGPTEDLFTGETDPRARDYVRGRFG